MHSSILSLLLSLVAAGGGVGGVGRNEDNSALMKRTDIGSTTNSITNLTTKCATLPLEYKNSCNSQIATFSKFYYNYEKAQQVDLLTFKVNNWLKFKTGTPQNTYVYQGLAGRGRTEEERRFSYGSACLLLTKHVDVDRCMSESMNPAIRITSTMETSLNTKLKSPEGQENHLLPTLTGLTYPYPFQTSYYTESKPIQAYFDYCIALCDEFVDPFRTLCSHQNTKIRQILGWNELKQRSEYRILLKIFEALLRTTANSKYYIITASGLNNTTRLHSFAPIRLSYNYSTSLDVSYVLANLRTDWWVGAQNLLNKGKGFPCLSYVEVIPEREHWWPHYLMIYSPEGTAITTSPSGYSFPKFLEKMSLEKHATFQGNPNVTLRTCYETHRFADSGSQILWRVVPVPEKKAAYTIRPVMEQDYCFTINGELKHCGGLQSEEDDRYFTTLTAQSGSFNVPGYAGNFSPDYSVIPYALTNFGNYCPTLDPVTNSFYPQTCPTTFTRDFEWHAFKLKLPVNNY